MIRRPTTAYEWWLQERGNQLDLAKFMYERVGDCNSMWGHLFAWVTPDIWHDPVYFLKEAS
jgi:hypothetical protein